MHQILCEVGETFTETFQMLQKAFEDECLIQSAANGLKGSKKAGHQSQTILVQDCPTVSTDVVDVSQVNDLVRLNRCLTIREMAVECNISFGSCQGISTEKLHMRRVAAKFVPRLMTEDQKQRRVQVFEELFQMANDDENFFENHYYWR